MSVFPGTRREVKKLIVKRRKKKKKIRERVSRKKATLKAMLTGPGGGRKVCFRLDNKLGCSRSTSFPII